MKLLQSPTGLGAPGNTINWSTVLLTGLAAAGAVGLFWFMLQHAGRASTRARNPIATRVQSLLFSRKAGWTVSRANRWAAAHGYRSRDADVTAGNVRLRQHDPKSFRRLRTVTFGKGIKAIVGR
jgi:hypothetical protein